MTAFIERHLGKLAILAMLLSGSSIVLRLFGVE